MACMLILRGFPLDLPIRVVCLSFIWTKRNGHRKTFYFSAEEVLQLYMGTHSFGKRYLTSIEHFRRLIDRCVIFANVKKRNNPTCVFTQLKNVLLSDDNIFRECKNLDPRAYERLETQILRKIPVDAFNRWLEWKTELKVNEVRHFTYLQAEWITVLLIVHWFAHKDENVIKNRKCPQFQKCIDLLLELP